MIDIESSNHHVRRSPIVRILRGVVPVLGAALLGACGAASEPIEGVDEVDDPIQGGQIENGFPAVGLVMTSDGGCTGTLIASRWVLTAKHCGGNNMKFEVGTSSANFVDYNVDTQRLHPSKDLLLAHLTSSPGVATLSLNTGALPAIGTVCTGVGFGDHDTDAGSTWGRKRSCTEKVESANDSTIKVKMVSGVADHGDSGGPLLCGGKIAAVVHNHTDGDWPAHIRENYATLDDDWIENTLHPPPPPPPHECGANQKCCEPAPNGGCSLCFARDLTCP